MEQVDSELKKAEQTRLKYYLQQYWVTPLKDPVLCKMASIFVDKPETRVLSVYSSDSMLLKQFTQRVLLSFGRYVAWENVESYSFVEAYLQGDAVCSQFYDQEMLIVDYGINKTPNKMHLPLVNSIIATRKEKGLYTLLLCHATNSELEFPPVTISGSSSKKDIV